jgi:hypothetical protein
MKVLGMVLSNRKSIEIYLSKKHDYKRDHLKRLSDLDLFSLYSVNIKLPSEKDINFVIDHKHLLEEFMDSEISLANILILDNLEIKVVINGIKEIQDQKYE